MIDTHKTNNKYCEKEKYIDFDLNMVSNHSQQIINSNAEHCDFTSQDLLKIETGSNLPNNGSRLAIVTLAFFSLRESSKIMRTESLSDSIPYTDTTWNSTQFCRTRSAPECSAGGSECSPLLTPCSCKSQNGHYGTSPTKHFCLMRNKSNKSGFASVNDVVGYVLKFDFITNSFVRIRRTLKKNGQIVKDKDELYQNYLDNEKGNNSKEESNSSVSVNNNIEGENNQNISKYKVQQINEEDQYFDFLEKVIFGNPQSMESVHLNHLFVKKNNKGLVPKLLTCRDKRRPSEEILRHNLEKVLFYEQNPQCASLDDVFEGCDCKDDVTFVRGTVGLSSAGACEV